MTEDQIINLTRSSPNFWKYEESNKEVCWTGTDYLIIYQGMAILMTDNPKTAFEKFNQL